MSHWKTEYLSRIKGVRSLEPYGYSGKDYQRLEETGSYGMNCRDSLK